MNVVKRLKYWSEIVINFFIKLKKIKNDKKKKIVMFNTPPYGNLGDQALFLAEEKFLEQQCPDFEFYDFTVLEVKLPEILLGLLKKYITPNDVIAIQAGGFLGTLWPMGEANTRKVFRIFKDNKIIVFPQTIYFEDDESGYKELIVSKKIYSECVNLNIFVREKYSYELLKEKFENIKKIILIPDMVLYLDGYKTNYKRKDILLCLRNDSEKTQNCEDEILSKLKYLQQEIKYTDTVVDYNISTNRKEEIEKKFDEFAKAKLVITDRLHGMVFAAITETPCIVIISKSHKVKGVYEWIENVKYIKLVEELSEFDNAVEEVLSVKEMQYDNKKIKEKYILLAKVINEINK